MIHIEQATAADVLEIKRVLKETWVDTYLTLLSAETIEQITAVWHAPERLSAEIENPHLYFADAKEESGKIVGLITAVPLNDDVIVIARLYVLPTYQRQGIGGRLMEQAVHMFPQHTVLRLDVEAENEKGLAFYRQHGFLEIGRRQDEVSNEVLQVVEMEKRLK